MEDRRETSGGCSLPLSMELEVEATSEAATELEPESRTNETSPIPASTAHSPILPLSEGVEVTAEVSESGADASSDPTDLTQKIVRQVEYYFSDENLPTDKFMLKYVKKNKEGFVPISVISSFRKMKKLVHDDDAVIAAALRTSSMLVVSKEGKRVRRLHPLPPPPEAEERRACILVENLPEDCSAEILQKIFAVSGQIRRISIRDPTASEEPPKISGKLHALVDYETPESAEHAVATLNDQKNWRSGMRVELLLKRMERLGLVSRSRKPGPSVADSAGPEGPTLGSGLAVESESTRVLSQARRRKQPGKGGPRTQQPGPRPISLTPAGPKMPDGTRGFAMGRGKPLPPGP